MDLYLTTSGRRVQPEFPSDLAAWPELAEAVDRARRLEREWQEASAAHLAAEGALRDAVAKDRAALADARLKGTKKLPTPELVQGAKAALEEATRQRDAADDARRRGAELVVEVLVAHRAEYVAKAREADEEARAREASALEAYVAAVNGRADALATLRWLERFPEWAEETDMGTQVHPHTRFRSQAPPVRHVGRREPIPFAEIEYALRVRAGLADPPPRTLAEQVRAAGREPAPEIVGGEAA